MSGVTLANEEGQTIWIDLHTLSNIISDALGAQDETLEEMRRHPGLWDDELPAARDSVEARGTTSREILNFMHNKGGNK